MKFVKFTAVALLTAIVAMGCNEERISFGEGDDTKTSNKGYLSLENLSIDCRIDDKESDAGLTPSTSSATRSRSSVDTSNFDCSIINKDKNEVVNSFKFSERPTGAIELETGDYIFKIQSGEVPGAAWEAPVYGAEKPFKIVRNETTPLSEVVCSLMQIKVSVSYSADLLERLGAKTLTIVTIGSNSLEYALTESRAGFFAAPQEKNTIELRISGTYAADKENFKPVEMTKEVRDVMVGQYSSVHFYIEHAAEGNISVGVTIRNWVTDEIITCNVADLVSEEEWKEDTDSGDDNTGEDSVVSDPSIEWIGYDISKRYAITGDLKVDLNIVASKGIKGLLCEIKSEVLTPDELLNNNLCNVLNLCYPTQSYDSREPDTYIDVEDALRALQFAVGDEVLNKKTLSLSITQFLGMLKAVSGENLKNHDFVLTVTDSEGNITSKTLMLQTGK